MHVGWRTQELHIEFWFENYLENCCLDKQVADKTIKDGIYGIDGKVGILVIFTPNHVASFFQVGSV
jgi:hypothetical protein